MNKIQSMSTKLPQNRSDYSVNWKNLLNTLRDEEKINDAAENSKPKKSKKRKSDLKNNSNSKKIKVNNGDVSQNATTSCAVDVENGDFSMQNGRNSSSIVKKMNSLSTNQRLKHSKASTNELPNLTKCLAIDCEFVGVGEDGFDDMVARVSLVNLFGECVYDKFVKPKEDVVDYRTHVSGVRKEDLVTAENLRIVQKEVSDLIKGRILVGHAVKKDLQVLFLSHPKKDLRDTSRYRPFRGIAKTSRPSLKKLANLVLGVSIQDGEHDSVTDARVTMQLYRTHRNEWESSLRPYFKKQHER